MTVTIDSEKRLRTIEIEPDEHMLIKPGELIDIVELSPLTLQDRRIYNLLILNAWDSITEPKDIAFISATCAARTTSMIASATACCG